MTSLLAKAGLMKPKDPLEDMKKWQRELKSEMRSMEREIKKIEQAEKKSEEECRKLAKANRIDACRLLAKEIVRTRAARDRMFNAKAQLNSVSMQLKTQASMVKAAGCVKKSTQVMTAMNKLVKLPELQKTMADMAREMERAGLIEDMVGDALESLDPAEIEDDTNKEVDAVVAELTSGLFDKSTTNVPTAVPQQPQQVADQPVVEDEQPSDLDAMKARLQAL